MTAFEGVTQTILYDEALNAQGVYGDCVRAAVATLLNLPIEAVPHFVLFADWTAAVEFWARGRGLTLKARPATEIPEQRCMVSARSPRGVMHMVIGEAGQVLWDPHPSRSGITDEIRAVYWFEPWAQTGGCPVCRTSQASPTATPDPEAKP